MPTIVAFCCMKDCVEYVDAWLENVSRADAILVQDGGSTDGTRERLIEHQKYNPKISLLLQTETTDKFQWNEQVVRNQCLGLFKVNGADADWILLMDADELIEDNFWNWFRNTNHEENIGYYIPHKNLWLDSGLFNIQVPWYPDLTMRLFHNHRGLYWVGAEHASLWKIDGMCSPTNKDTPIIGDNIHFVHYHRAEKNYKEAILSDAIPHHSGEKDNMKQTPILARLRSHPKGAELIRKRFE